MSLGVGNIDPLYLFGEGSNGALTEEKGYGLALAGGFGNHDWCMNEIPGVTDNIPGLGLSRGKKHAKE